MQKHIISVLASFSGVTMAILLGIIIAYNTNVIPSLERELDQERESAKIKSQSLENLQNEMEVAQEGRLEAERRLAEKLAEEEVLALEKARQEQEARIAAEKAAAEEARIAAEKAATKNASKKSKAS